VLILTTDRKNQLGDDNLFAKTCKEDKIWFQKISKHYKTCLVGKNTAQTLPKLTDRNVIIIQRNQNYTNGIIIGGKKIYEHFWDKVTVIYRSIHKNQDLGGETFEPSFDNLVLVDRVETDDLIKEVWIPKSLENYKVRIL